MSKQVAELEELRAELKAVVEKAREERKAKRSFRGFKATLVISDDKATYEVPIRYARLTSRIVDEKMAIRAIRRSTREPVEQKYVQKVVAVIDGEVLGPARELRLKLADGREAVITARSERIWLTPSGEEVSPEDVAWVQEVDGQEVEVERFDRTKEIVVEQLIPCEQVDDFLPEGEYEIWAEEPRHVQMLKRVAEFMRERGVAGLCTHFSFGGFKAYAAVIYPVFTKDGRFGFIMRLTRMRRQLQHLMPVDVRVEKPKPRKPKPRSVLLL